MKQTGTSLEVIRRYLARARGAEYWRSLEEFADTEEFRKLLHREYPRYAAVWLDALDRRQFLKVMGASLALAGLGACSPAPAPKDEKIVPYTSQPEEIIPGKPLFFATAMPLNGFGRGVLAESHMGRPTKIEGNPEHPASLGASDVFMQASVLDLYDPDRSAALVNAGRITTWNAFFTALNAELESQRLNQGAGLRILTETVTSPTLGSQFQELLRQFPKAQWHQYAPLARDSVLEGSRLAFGEPVATTYRLDRADVVFAIDSDFLFFGPAALRYARDFSSRRRVTGPQSEMNRLYAVESTPTVTGTMADHRLALAPGAIAQFSHAVAKSLGIAVESAESSPAGINQKWISALARDLQQHRGRSVVLAGEQQPASVHVLAHAMNHALGNVGATVFYSGSAEVEPINNNDSLGQLVRDMEDNRVQVLVIIGGNPVYTAPADVKFGSALVKSNFAVHLSSHLDETSALCHWHIPQAHYLESWSDVRAFDGTATIIQPLIAPLYGGRTAHDLVAALLGQPGKNSYDIVRGYWQQQKQGGDFEEFWRRSVHDGVVAGTAAPIRNVALKANSFAAQGAEKTTSTGGLTLLFRADPTILDGAFANNGWLQETPKPLTKLTWENAVFVSPATADRLNVSQSLGSRGGEHGTVETDMVELEYQGRRIRGPVWILPGQADDCITVHLGYGRGRAGRVGTNIGFNANALRTADAPWNGHQVRVRAIGAQAALACTQFHHMMEGRHLVRAATLDEYRKNPKFVDELEEKVTAGSLYPGFKYAGKAWGMAIDVNACIGCNACVVACVAENNIPVVGKQEVLHGREMHWIRIDRYYKGKLDNPETYHQPVPCMQCENAPCELVCPVHATTHSDEGLNDMTYNRCVGTRYCSNNCPYKVRRFNFLLYSDFSTESLKLLRNPDVTVRSRGVMEKCTYCVQRIRETEITAENEDRAVRDGEVVTACQQACPTQAIVFGDINEKNSQVAKIKSQSRDYTLLAELNTRPRTSYEAKLTNPNPEIESA